VHDRDAAARVRGRWPTRHARYAAPGYAYPRTACRMGSPRR